MVLGRLAGVLFVAAAIAAAPANALLSDPAPSWYVHAIEAIALLTGLACVLVPWRRIHRRWLHLIPLVATFEVTLTVSALGVHGDVFLWYYLLAAIFIGYAFRRRAYVIGHMTVLVAGFAGTALKAFAWDQDALVRALVGIPTLCVAAGVVTWLRESLEARERVVAELARTDSLTGLGNRRAMIEALEAAVAPGEPERTFAIFDLDGFKAYNDRFGHPAGDALLERLGRRLAAAVSDRGRAFRLGGDEFCILVEGPVGDCTLALSEAGEHGIVRASHGAVVVPTEAASASAALSTADARMYATKQRVRRRTLPYVDELIGR